MSPRIHYEMDVFCGWEIVEPDRQSYMFGSIDEDGRFIRDEERHTILVSQEQWDEYQAAVATFKEAQNKLWTEAPTELSPEEWELVERGEREHRVEMERLYKEYGLDGELDRDRATRDYLKESG